MTEVVIIWCDIKWFIEYFLKIEPMIYKYKDNMKQKPHM